MKRTISLLCCLLLLGGCAVPQENDLPLTVPSDQSEQSVQNGQTEQTTQPAPDPQTEPALQPEAPEQNETTTQKAPDFASEFTAGGTGTGVEISCMSFNVLSYDTNDENFAEPAERSPLVTAFIMEQNCDIVGLQEVSESDGYNWVKAIAEGVGQRYHFRMLTQEEDSAYTRMGIAAGLMILYRKDRFELRDSGCFEYFEDANRYYQWVKLWDRKAQRELFVTNTHFSIDPNWNPEYGNIMRTDEAKELAEFWEGTVRATPLFATGDYNSYEYDDPHLLELQTSVFQPSSLVAESLEGSSTIDFVYLNTLSMQCTRHLYLSSAYTDAAGDRVEMSDHRPVVAYAKYK